MPDTNWTIREVSQDEFRGLGQNFNENLGHMGENEFWEESETADKQIFQPKAEKAERISETYSFKDSKYICFVAEYHFRTGTQEAFNGIAGTMVVENKASETFVHFITAHPYSKGVGFALIKKAIDFSRENGKGGTVALGDHSGGSFYDNIGFELRDNGDKVLKNGTIKEHIV